MAPREAAEVLEGGAGLCVMMAASKAPLGPSRGLLLLLLHHQEHRSRPRSQVQSHDNRCRPMLPLGIRGDFPLILLFLFCVFLVLLPIEEAIGRGVLVL